MKPSECKNCGTLYNPIVVKKCPSCLQTLKVDQNTAIERKKFNRQLNEYESSKYTEYNTFVRQQIKEMTIGVNSFRNRTKTEYEHTRGKTIPSAKLK